MEKSFDALSFSPYANPGAWARPRGGVIDYTVNVPEAGDYRIAVEYRSVSRLELALAADGGRYKRKAFPPSDGYRKAFLGTRRLEAGAAVVKIGVVNAAGARLRAIVVGK